MGADSNVVFVSSLDPVDRNSVGCIDFTLMPEGSRARFEKFAYFTTVVFPL
jgi:hypothetical protein